MAPSLITTIHPYTKSSPPPQPMMVSLWATNIHGPQTPIPVAHRDIPKFDDPATAVKVLIPVKELKVIVPPAVPSVAIIPKATATSSPAPTGIPAASEVSLSSTAAVDDSCPPSPLISLDDSSDSDSNPDSDSAKIPRPAHASTIPLPKLFHDWDSKRLAAVQAHIKTIAKTHLPPNANFNALTASEKKTVNDCMTKEFPFLKDYARNWPVTRLLVAHLKTKRNSYKQVAHRNALDAVGVALKAGGSGARTSTAPRGRGSILRSRVLPRALCSKVVPPPLCPFFNIGVIDSSPKRPGPHIPRWNKTKNDVLGYWGRRQNNYHMYGDQAHTGP
ncbi:hypothetical protein DFH07DRAFT_766215 [Mycena maculata]|uniref:Uncharacterized protein n=2 Tax=Mycena maculata TaxID=230809 RepID=A0AAD7NWK7_9AGAR|nr:hypothetical protein DFH07DRAFT_766215 [Mycena maculata]